MSRIFSLYRSSAGSGKTRTLAKAWLKLALQYRADYFKHILAVTFTNKASQEMKDRILYYLDEFAKGGGGALAQELQEELSMDSQTFQQHSQATQLTLLHQYDNFSISTIDAFFQKVIRSFTREAGLVGDYRLEIDQDAVLEEVVDSLIDELGDNRDLTEWVVEFARENLENEKSWDVRYSLIDFAKEIFREEFKDIEDDVVRTTGDRDLFKRLRERWWSIKNSFLRSASVPAREIRQMIRNRGWDGSDFSYGNRSGLFGFIDQFINNKNLSKIKEPGERIRDYFTDPVNWPNKKSRHAKDILAAATTDLAPRLRMILDIYDSEYPRALSAEVALANMYVFGLITDISRKLKEYKDENSLMLLADAPKFLNGVIRDSDTPFIYEKVGSFYRNYLIDEFQDTSGLQWQNFQPLIINSLDQGYPSLVVGDVKQAIYRWRGGDLSLLQEKIAGVIGPERVAVHELDNNFRSAREVVEFNNALFRTASSIVALDAGSSSSALAYEDVTQKVSKDESGFVEIQFLSDEALAGSEDQEPRQVSLKEKALDLVPRTLERLQEAGARLRDIAILVRKNDEGQQIANYLLQYKNSVEAKENCSYDVVSNESLRIDGAASVNLLLGAMRYLLNTDDSIARAQLAFEYARIHEPERDLPEVFSVSNQATFENNLPEGFARQKGALKKLPLIELTETLIELFRLGRITGELVYMQAFQDLVLEFCNRERNDLGAFLEWWEANRNKKSIQISGEVDAAQILTIHKSKGLQFRYIIIPFCSWSMDHETWQAPNLWVKSGEAPFADAGYLPVKYASNLEKTFFGDYYREERTKVYLDNLNLLYVAFTRAESGLIVTAPSTTNARGAKRSIAELLANSIQRDSVLQTKWDQVTERWTSGVWDIRPQPEKTGQNAVQLNEYLASGWRDKLVIRKAASDWFGSDEEVSREKLNYGIHIHEVLSRMHYSDQMAEMLDRMVHEGLIASDERGTLEKQLRELLNNPEVSDWFSRDWDIRTEVPIILPGGQENRIDRLMIRDKSAIVVDFKTGSRRKQDEKQVLEYMEILRRMNFTQVRGYLLYLADKTIVEVKSGTKPRLIQKVKDRDQLDLGF